jgi:hypothetical protein
VLSGGKSGDYFKGLPIAIGRKKPRDEAVNGRSRCRRNGGHFGSFAGKPLQLIFGVHKTHAAAAVWFYLQYAPKNVRMQIIFGAAVSGGYIFFMGFCPRKGGRSVYGIY